MAQQANRTNSFNDKIRPATIIAVYPQTKTVDIRYTQNDGSKTDLDLPYQVVGATWGRLYMPQIGDRVLVDFTQGDAPLIVGMKPTNVDFLPYLDPGELVDMSADGSFIHLRNARRRVKSTGVLIGYNATKGPNGETDIELEPGGIVLEVRSKQDISTKAPRWYEHSYMSMFENGDIALQSRYRGQNGGLLYMDGASGYVFLVAGKNKPQEYVELDPVNKVITIVSDQDIHQFNQQDWKITVYNNQIQNIANALQINLGIPPSVIPGDFDLIDVDSDVENGDFKFSNLLGTSGKYTLDIKGDTNITVFQGNVQLLVELGNIDVTTNTGSINVLSNSHINLTSETGNMNVNVDGGQLKVTTSGDANVQSGSDVNITTDGSIYLNGGGDSNSRVATIGDINSHTHTNVQNGKGISGTAVPYNGSANVFAGS